MLLDDAGNALPGPDASAVPDAGGQSAPDAASSGRDVGSAGSPDVGTRPDASLPIPPDGSTPITPDAGSSVCSGAGCLAPATCSGNIPAASYRAQVVPATLAPSQSADVSVTFANCSGHTWTAAQSAGAATGIKLGSWAPQDNYTWGADRFALPADVPDRYQVLIPFTVKAPANVGPQNFAWALVNEGVAWIAEPSLTVQVDVVSAPVIVALCSGVTADATGQTGAAAALQQCIDATPDYGTLEIPAGIYRMDGQVKIAKPMTLRTAGLSGVGQGCLNGATCAVLTADPNLNASAGMLRLENASDVVIDHLGLDGNRLARLSSAAATACAAGNNRGGFNASAGACSHCSFTWSASVRALCGTGFEWLGDDAVITDSLFAGNGDHNTQNMWSDGLTLLASDRAVVERNVMADNSDVGFICGGSRAGSLKDNTITQSLQPSFAGLMLDNFNAVTHGDFTGATVTGNTVSCGSHQCDFGIELGPHPWYLSTNILGGTVSGNSVANAKQGINVEGAGTAGSPIRVFANTITGSSSSAQFLCGTKTCSAYNISPDSVVDRNGETAAVTTWTWHNCP